jgi:hypothetical protein
MGSKYGSYKFEREQSREEQRKVHPVWRAIGFVLMILVPIMSAASVNVILKLNEQYGWFPLTADMMVPPEHLLYKIYPDPMLYIYIVIFLICLLFFSSVFSLIVFAMNSSFGVTDKKDPFYVPPVRRTTPRRRR